MANPDADREILFGLLAHQNGLVDQAQLVGTIQDWAHDKSRPLGDHLLAAGHLDAKDLPALDALVARQLEKHGGSAERSLATIPAGAATLETLARVGDPDVDATLGNLLASVAMTQAGDAGVDGAATFTVGTGSAAGQRFRILRPHARGGLGAVFVALDEELHREVALKQMLEKHADDPVSRARFVLEAEVTGGLEHPGIVPVYGMGTDAGGRPYYAMRFIRGDSLKEAVDRFHADAAVKGDPGRRSLELRQLLRQLIDVCNAVEYAHSRGVLHRDIKPANIIVGRHGETLVVDWGLAKAGGPIDPGEPSDEPTLMPRSASGSAETLPGRSMGTPSFMSPEQAEGDLENLGTRSDVYSLGATLYYLLTGKMPFAGDLMTVLRAVKAGEFTRPRLHDAAIDRALEAVCLKAMALRPADRYASARAVAEDVERWMADEPVSAWREPFSRRARRWARRNRTAVAAAAVALVAGVVGLSAIVAVQTQAKADIARALGRETQANAALATANDELIQSKEAVQARYELAVEAIKTFHTGVSEDFLLREEKFQSLRDRLLKSAADFYGKLGALLGRETDLSSRRALAAANFELAGLTAKVGRNADALAAHRSVLEARRALASEPGAGPADQAEVGRSLTEVAGLLEAAGKTDLALAAYRDAEGVLSAPAAGSREACAALAACRSRMGGFLTTIGKNGEALAAYRLARADQEALAASSPEARRDLGDTVNRIGRLLSNTGRPREAEVEYRQAMAIRQALVDEDPSAADVRTDLAASRNNLGLLLVETGRASEGEAEQRQALAIRQALADHNPAVSLFREHVAASHFNLGMLLLGMGRPSDAEAEQRQALAIHQKLVEENPAVTRFRSTLANNHVNLGRLLTNTGRSREGEAEYRNALAIQRELVEQNPAITGLRSSLGLTYVNLGVLLAETGRPAEVEFRAARSIYQELMDHNPAVTEYRLRLALAHVNLGDLMYETGRSLEAEPEYRAAATIYHELSDRNPAVTQFRHYLAYSRDHLGVLLTVLGRPSEAEAESRQALALYQELADRNPKVPDYGDGVGGAFTNLGDVMRAAGRMTEARDAYDRAVAVRERLVKEYPTTPVRLSNLAASLRRRGQVRRDLGDPAGAAVDVRRALGLSDRLPSRSRQEWYETACCHATLAGLAGPRDSAGQAAPEADAAIALLHRAVAMGFRNADAIRTESALDPLRGRPEFRLILLDLAMPDEPFAAAR